jgi:aminoglycoside 2''-phosphotransferase
MKRNILDRIKNEFPEISWKKHRFIDHGWDHHVAVLDERFVFRTPKRFTSDPPGEFSDEIRLLHYLKGRVKINIPYYQYISATGSMAGYEMLNGKELEKKLFDSLNPFEKAAVAEQYAGFITALHSVPKCVLKKFHIRVEDESKLCEQFARRTRKNIYLKINKKSINAIEDFIKELKFSIGKITHRTLVHNDLTGEHILWDRKRQQVNIIDFSDRCYGDPAADFAGIMEYGMNFVKKVYGLYGCRKDESLLHRAELYYKRVPLSIMLDSLDGFPCTFKQGYKMFKERFGV